MMRIKRILPIVLIVAGIGLMVLGTHLGEVKEFLRKATMVCLECIGIG